MTQFQNPCQAGTFNKEVGLERQDQCLDCLPGYYCQAGDQNGDTLCPGGYYCPHKTGDPNAKPCTAGTYTEEQGAQSKNLGFLFVFAKGKTIGYLVQLRVHLTLVGGNTLNPGCTNNNNNC